MNKKNTPYLLVLLVLIVVGILWLQNNRNSDTKFDVPASHDLVNTLPENPTVATELKIEPTSQIPATEELATENASEISPPTWRPSAVFGRQMTPAPQNNFSRGKNASRRYHDPLRLEIDPALAERRPLVLAASPRDGRFHLLPEEIDEHTKQAGRLIFDPAALDGVIEGRASRILAPTLNEEVLTLEFEKITTRDANTHTFQGHVVGKEEMSVAQIVYHDGIIHGSVMDYDTSQEIEYRILQDGHMMIRELDHSSMTHQCETCSPEFMANIIDEDTLVDEGEYVIRNSDIPTTRDTGGWRTLDVVTGYGKEARIEDGGYAQIEARIIDAVDRMTFAFDNSGIQNSEVMLLGTIEDPDYAYSDSAASGMYSEISGLRTLNGSDGGVLDTVTDFGDQLGADVITFTIKSNRGSVAGVASGGPGIDGRYAIVARNAMTLGNMTYSHEIGHVLGCAHAWGDTGYAVDHSRFAWRFRSPDNGNRYRTITAYNLGLGGSTIPYWSNPNISFAGAPTGAPNGYDMSADPNEPGDPLFYGTVDNGNPYSGFDGTHPDLGANNAEVIDAGDFSSGFGLDYSIARATRTSFEVLNPTAGAQWEKGTTQMIQFNGGDMDDLARIELYKGGVLHSTLASDVNPATHRIFAWTIPFDLTDDTDYMIRVELDRNGSTIFADSGIFEIFRNLPHIDTASAPAVPEGIGSVSSLELTFNVPMDPSTFDLVADIISFTDPVGTSIHSSITGTAWSADNTVLTIEFTAPNDPGAYQLTIGPNISDTEGNLMDQDMDGIAGENVEDRHTVNFVVPPPLAYYASMDTDPGWTFSANNSVDGWEFGQPTGGSGPTDGTVYNQSYGITDPTSGFNGPNVVGYNLDGDYERGITTTRWATTSVIDCSAHENVRLRFQRWLGIFYGIGVLGDNAYLEVSNDGVNWTNIWHNYNLTLREARWVEVEYDISAVADRQSTVYVRWGMGTTNSSPNDDSCGWNIDEVVVFGDYIDGNDSTPPVPSPMTFANAPAVVGLGSISMTASTALDLNDVEYYFTETSGNPGGDDSGWQESPTYTDTGLSSGTEYTYTVKARDKSVNLNETVASSPASAITDPPDLIVPNPDPMSFASAPTALGQTSVRMTATTATDENGVEYYFEETTGLGNDSGWQDNPTYTDTGLIQNAQYSYRVKARDKSPDHNETAYSGTAQVTTHADIQPPTIHSLNPVDGAIYVPVANDLIINFNEDITTGTGLVTIKNLTDGTQTTIDITDGAQVSISGMILTINPSADLLESKDYSIQIANTAIADLAGNVFIGISDDTTWNFTTFIPFTYTPGSALSSGATGPIIDALDIVNSGSNAGTDKFFLDTPTHGQTFLTGAEAVELRSFSFKSALTSNAAQPTKTYLVRVGTISGSTFTEIYSETLTQTTIWDAGHYLTWAFSTPVSLDANTLYAVDVDMSSSTSTWQTGIPYLAYTQNLYADGSWYTTADGATVTYHIYRDRVFHLDLVPASGSVNDFANWIDGYDVGGQTGFSEDPDGDDLSNGIENYFGTAPNAFTVGLVPNVVNTNSGTFTFSHPLNDNPASDITAVYRWSKDLSNFYRSGEADGDETIVTIVQDPPSGGMVSVTATITGTTTDKVFIDIEVTQD